MTTATGCDWTRHLPRASHAVQDVAKLEAMVETLRKGEYLPPVVVWGDESNDSSFALCGSHRIAAYAEARERMADDTEGEWDAAADLSEIPVVFVGDDEMEAVADAMGLELADILRTRDFNDLCWHASREIESPAARAALADQI